MNCFGEDCLYDAIVEAGDNVTTCTAGPYTTCFVSYLLHGPSMFAVKAKIYTVPYNQSILSLLMKHLSTGQCKKAPNFSAFHWSPHGSLVSTGQHFVTTRVVHLPKRTETNLITEADLITELDRAVQDVHSYNSWLQ